MDTLKKAGLMTQHLDLFHHMQDLRGLLQLAAHMEEKGDRAALISASQLTLIGQESLSTETINTSKGATIPAAVVYRLIASLKGFEDEEYTVNRKELAALNTRAVAELENSDALKAFGETLARIQGEAGAARPVTFAQPEMLAQATAQPEAQPDMPTEPAQAGAAARAKKA